MHSHFRNNEICFSVAHQEVGDKVRFELAFIYIEVWYAFMIDSNVKILM